MPTDENRRTDEVLIELVRGDVSPEAEENPPSIEEQKPDSLGG